MADFLETARDEMAGLRSRLEADPLFLRYQKLAELVALYEGGGIQATPSPPPKSVSASPRFDRAVPQKKIQRVPNPKRERALALAEAVLEGRHEPTKTAEIYEVIMAQGAEIGGENPQGNLSAMLHHSNKFTSHKRRGWTLSKYDGLTELLGSEPESPPEEDGTASDNIAETQEADDLYSL